MKTVFDRVVVAIPTMPGRESLLAELMRQLQDQCAGAAFSIHGHAEAKVDFPETIRDALVMGKEWILQIEDDAWPCPLFGLRVSSVLVEAENMRASALTLFSRASKDVKMLADGVHWRTQPTSSFCMMQAVALRRDTMLGFYEWAPTWYQKHPEHKHAADLLLGAWLSKNRKRMFVHVPSLVQHRAVKSTLTGRYGARQSKTYMLEFGEAP